MPTRLKLVRGGSWTHTVYPHGINSRGHLQWTLITCQRPEGHDVVYVRRFRGDVRELSVHAVLMGARGVNAHGVHQDARGLGLVHGCLELVFVAGLAVRDDHGHLPHMLPGVVEHLVHRLLDGVAGVSGGGFILHLHDLILNVLHVRGVP